MTAKVISFATCILASLSSAGAFGKTLLPSSVILISSYPDNGSQDKITRLLTENSKIAINTIPKAVCRFNSAVDSRRILILKGKELPLQIIAPIIAKPDKLCIVGAEAAFEPERLGTELRALHDLGIKVTSGNLKISATTPLILPFYLDPLPLKSLVAPHHAEASVMDLVRADTICHRAICAGDLIDLNQPENLEHLQQKLKALIKYHNILRHNAQLPEISEQALLCDLKSWAPIVAPYITDISAAINTLHKEQQPFLVEGILPSPPALSTSLTTEGAFTADSSLGISLKNKVVIGIIRPYTIASSVSSFSTTMDEQSGQKIIAATTAVSRAEAGNSAYGWLDLVALKQLIRVNGINGLILTQGEDLDGFETIKVCTGYKIDGLRIDTLPLDISHRARLKPIYKEFKGWKGSKGVKIYQDLDHNYRIFVKFLEQETQLPVIIISTGPKTEDAVIRQSPFTLKLPT
ncbi:adenylosuccinate synthetase [Candidatus Odyssella thessalonicensis]|uniref:adenylosuccinate synthetase n=1 Tax=Candidatus Odyssella thessalonicensis TaxID=84647 RepID=UPI000225B4C8|nr:adenylosuccinate synthetase [Candidatus Odyssella thessalonicensis]